MKPSNVIPGTPTGRLEFLSGAPTSGRLTARSLPAQRANFQPACLLLSFGFRVSGFFRPSGIRPSLLSLALLALLFFSTLPAFAADNSFSQKANQTVEDTKNAIQGAGQATSDSIDELWRRLDEARLKNRRPDEIMAWIIMGVLVGAVAGMLTSLKSPGKVGYLVCGLIGAFIGGIVVNVTRVNFGWGPVLIRYEELLFSFAGAILVIVLLKLTGLKKFM